MPITVSASRLNFRVCGPECVQPPIISSMLRYAVLWLTNLTHSPDFNRYECCRLAEVGIESRYRSDCIFRCSESLRCGRPTGQCSIARSASIRSAIGGWVAKKREALEPSSGDSIQR